MKNATAFTHPGALTTACRKPRGFTLVECLIASVITVICFVGTVTLLSLAKFINELEQERSRAHQIVSQALEVERYKLFTWTASDSTQTIWDNGTPGDTTDDITGQLQLIVTDPNTGTVLTAAPNPATLVQIEATLSWYSPGARLSNKVHHETVMTYKAP